MEYDPLLAKLVGYAETRDQAIDRLLRALYEYFVGGIKTNISLFRRILKDPEFRAGNIDTGFLERLLAHPAPETDPRRPIIAAVAAGIFATMDPRRPSPEQTAYLRLPTVRLRRRPSPAIGGARRALKGCDCDDLQRNR
jgi:acetyl-CoA carboxylase biotin carboxylase subunit